MPLKVSQQTLSYLLSSPLHSTGEGVGESLKVIPSQMAVRTATPPGGSQILRWWFLSQHVTVGQRLGSSRHAGLGSPPHAPPAPPPSLSRGQRGLHQPTGLPASPGVALALTGGGYSLKNTAEDRASSQVQPPDVCLLSLHSSAAAERASGRWPLASFYFRRRKNASVSEVTPGPSGGGGNAVPQLCSV